VQVSELDARLAREQARPKVNLTAQLGSQGLAGTVLPQSGNIFGSALAPLINRVDELSALAGLPMLSLSSGNNNSVPAVFKGGYGQSLQNLRNG